MLNPHLLFTVFRSNKNVTPTFDELEKFNKPSENGEAEFGGLSTLFANRKKGHFMKGDAVIVIKGDLKNLKGWVEKVDEENVLIRSGMKGLPVSILTTWLLVLVACF